MKFANIENEKLDIKYKTIDTNINQFIKVYHIFDKLQYKGKNLIFISANNIENSLVAERERIISFLIAIISCPPQISPSFQLRYNHTK